MLRILHLIRHVPCHLLLKEKASDFGAFGDSRGIFAIVAAGGETPPLRGTAGAHTKLLKSTEREDFWLVELRRAQRRGPRPTAERPRRNIFALFAFGWPVVYSNISDFTTNIAHCLRGGSI